MLQTDLAHCRGPVPARRRLAGVGVGRVRTKLSWAPAACTDRPARLKDRDRILALGGFQQAHSSEEPFLSPAVHALQRIFYQQKKLFYNQLMFGPGPWI